MMTILITVAGGLIGGLLGTTVFFNIVEALERKRRK